MLPQNGVPSSSISAPSGTMILTSPKIAWASISIIPLGGSSASVKSSVTSPQMARTWISSAGSQRPARWLELQMARNDSCVSGWSSVAWSAGLASGEAANGEAGIAASCGLLCEGSSLSSCIAP